MAETRWPDHLIADGPTLDFSAFSDVVEQAPDERPIQDFLADHPKILLPLLPLGWQSWCFDRPRLGAEYVPDFLLCTENSSGLEWVMLELESPTRPVLNQQGRPSAKLVEAQGQIRDWRAWLRNNIAYARDELGFDGLSAESRAVIVIGRRTSIVASQATRYRELSDSFAMVMTYDRLLDVLRVKE